MSPPDDVQAIRSQHPLWIIGTVWAIYATGSDLRVLTGSRAGMAVSAATAPELDARISEAEQLCGWDD